MSSLITSDNIFYNKLVKQYGPIYNRLDKSTKKEAQKMVLLAVKAGYQQACLDMKSKRIPDFKNSWYDYDDDDDY